MFSVFDDVLGEETFQRLSLEASTVKGECEFALERDEAYGPITHLVSSALDEVDLVASFFMETPIGGAGSRPHHDHGTHAAVLHLNPKWDLGWGGEFLAVDEDHQTISRAVEFRPNRMTVTDKTQLHAHRPPLPTAPRSRVTLVMRFT